MHEPKRAAQAGFSMIEMLITAFILAVGLLGLAMFQTMSLRASRGSRSVNTAVMVAEQIMDQAEMEGRLSWLNVTDSALTNGTLATLTNIKYLNIANPLTEYFNSQGGPVDTTSADPALNTQFFTAVTSLAPAVAAVVGNVTTVSVNVSFIDNRTGNNTPITRNVYLSRRIVHG